MTGGAARAVVLSGAGGLLLAGGGTAGWVRQDTVRIVGEVSLPDVITAPGNGFAPGLLAVGMVAVAGALLLLPLRRAARRLLGWGLAGLGLLGLALTAAGLLRAMAAQGALLPGPALAGLGGLVVLGGGLLAARGRDSAPALGARYDIDVPVEPAGSGQTARVPDDDADARAVREWQLASVEPEER